MVPVDIVDSTETLLQPFEKPAESKKKSGQLAS